MKKLGISLLCALCFFCFSCETEEPATPKDLAAESLIPKPVSLEATGSSFRITPDTDIFVDGDSSQVIVIGNYLANLLRPSTGYDVSVSALSAEQPGKHIFLSLTDDTSLGMEGYELEITRGRVDLKAHQPAGLFYGVQTIRQLLPANVERNNQQSEAWEIATGKIRDFPEYEYRGAMLDVARHFFFGS